MSPSEKFAYQRKLDRLKEYIEMLKTENINDIRKNKKLKMQIERNVYLIAEVVLDIADLILHKRKLPKAESYADSIRNLALHKIISEEFCDQLVFIAYIRNSLAHDYLKDTSSILFDFQKNKCKLVEDFYAIAEKELS